MFDFEVMDDSEWSGQLEISLIVDDEFGYFILWGVGDPGYINCTQIHTDTSHPTLETYVRD